MARRRGRSTGALHHITSIHLCEKHPVRRTEAVRKDNQALMSGVRGQAAGQVAAGRACGSHDTDKLARLWRECRYQDVPEEAAAAECVFLSPSLPPRPSSQTIWSRSLPALPPRSLHAACSLSKPNLSPPSPALGAYVCVCLRALLPSIIQTLFLFGVQYVRWESLRRQIADLRASHVAGG